MRNESEKELSVAVSLVGRGAVLVSVMPIASRLQKRCIWVSGKSKSWNNSMLLIATWCTETPDLFPLRIHPKVDVSKTKEGDICIGGVFDQFPVMVAAYQHLYRKVGRTVIGIGQT